MAYEEVELSRDVEVVVFDPPWNQQMMSEAAKLELGML
jgi:metal-sulfur cluster biosynthetic enzyme